MTDRELLELAAKAIDGEYDHLSRSIRFDGGFNFLQWNPLEDDGDALRLAMHLELGVVCKRESDPYERYTSVVTNPYCVNQLRIAVRHNGNPESATRRAIVVAAAEIEQAQNLITERRICPGCGKEGFTANCMQCVPY